MYYLILLVQVVLVTAQKVKFLIKDLLSKCDQIRRKLCIWSHLLKKPLLKNIIFCAVRNLCNMCLDDADLIYSPLVSFFDASNIIGRVTAS